MVYIVCFENNLRPRGCVLGQHILSQGVHFAKLVYLSEFFLKYLFFLIYVYVFQATLNVLRYFTNIFFQKF